MPRSVTRFRAFWLAAVCAATAVAAAPVTAPKPGQRPNAYVGPYIPAVDGAGKPMPWGGAVSERFTEPAWQAVQPIVTNWEVKGVHSVNNGILRLGDPNQNRENCCIMSKKPYINFSLEADCRLASDPAKWGGFGLWFRAAEARGLYRNDDLAPGGTNGYAFNFTPGLKALVLERRAHTYRLAPSVPMIADRNWHKFRVQAVGNDYTCWVDGKLIFKATDPSPRGPYWWGYVGVGVNAMGSVDLRSVTITPL